MPDQYVLIGESVSNSPTPRMMEAAFKELAVDAEYRSSNVKASDLGPTFEKLKESEIRGANVTIPHKRSIIPLLDSLDECPSKIGAVNTIKREEGKYRGFNTDVDGIVGPLKAKGLSKAKRAAVLGTGGAARAFCGAMHQLGCTNLLIIYRNREHAATFVSSMGSAFPELVIESTSDDALPDWKPDLLFNATPAGANGIQLPARLEGFMGGRPAVFDAVYFPVETELVRMATRIGCRVIYGHEMLLHQGLGSVQIWTGMTPPTQVMARALYAALGVVAT